MVETAKIETDAMTKVRKTARGRDAAVETSQALEEGHLREACTI